MSPVFSTTSVPSNMLQQIPTASSLKRSRFSSDAAAAVESCRFAKKAKCVADATDSSDDSDSQENFNPVFPVPRTKNAHFVNPLFPQLNSEFDAVAARSNGFFSDSDSPDLNSLVKPRHNSINVGSLRRHRRSVSAHRKRRSSSVPHKDVVARSRCFEYLVSSIDEVWAQYCCTTSNAEDEMYNEEIPPPPPRRSSMYQKPKEIEIPNTPSSMDEDAYSSANDSQGPLTPYSYSEPQYMGKNTKCGMNTFNNTLCLAPSEQPDSVRLLNVKKRLMNAKYFLQDLLDCDEIESSVAFWNRWDMIKYTAIELVEEDGDDDDVVESVTEELEDGRYYRGSY